MTVPALGDASRPTSALSEAEPRPCSFARWLSSRVSRSFNCTYGRSGAMVFMAALCTCLLLVGCQRRGEAHAQVVVEHDIAPLPPQVGPATITVRLTDAANRPINMARIELEGHMTHAGMSPVFGAATELEPGRYQAPLEFTMAGDWIILLHIALPDGTESESEFAVRGVGLN